MNSVADVLILCEKYPMSFSALLGILIWGALTFGCDNTLSFGALR
jgi:hypothetical protein